MINFIFTGLCLICYSINALSPHRAMLYLNKYGYLQLPRLDYLNSPEYERSLIMDGNYSSAIKKFQKTFNLPQTGFLNTKIAKMLVAKRCGNPDYGSNPIGFNVNIRTSNRAKRILKRVKRYYIDNPQMKWLKKDLTWKIKSYPSKGLNRPQVRAIMTRAFNLWAKHVDINYTEETGYYNDADIIIEFGSKEHGDSIPFDGPNYVLAHAFYPIGSSSPPYSRSGDAHFDDDEFWVEQGRDGRNLLAVAVHELGHSMGLGHSASETAIMYPFYVNPTEGNIKLDIDDINGMQSIYGSASYNKRLPPVPDVPNNIPIYTLPKYTTVAPPINKKIDFCDTTVDAIITIREVEIYVFSGKLQWRIDFSKTVTSWISYELRDGPEDLNYYWPILPKTLDKIDGGIERKDQKIYIFRKNRFWLLEDNTKLSNPNYFDGLPLEVLGLPANLEKIDTIFRWDYNKAIYIMAGYKYWKINEASGEFGYVYPRYPRSIHSVWKDLPLPLDVAYTGLHGKTFFIKGKYFYEFNNLEMKIVEGGPKPLTPAWIGCKKYS
uniref:Mmp protein n=1 Tax=Schmidtea mediterranea TaxID=79327 RepID=K0JB92_SCHMD|nr:mmp protein [Schmidtea mediterranea]